MSIFQINRIFATMKKLILITGGQRSGKSMQAEKMALEMSPNPIYMATAHIWDDEFRERVRRHQERRGPEWTNIEEEIFLCRHDVSGHVVLIDCVTLWLTIYSSQKKMSPAILLMKSSNLQKSSLTVSPVKKPPSSSSPTK